MGVGNDFKREQIPYWVSDRSSDIQPAFLNGFRRGSRLSATSPRRIDPAPGQKTRET